MKQLYFCRHGESELNAQQIFSGQIDTPLTNRGREQARVAGESATKLGITRIVCSTLSRAHETAELIADKIGIAHDQILTNPIFIERSHGELEGLPWNTPDDGSYENIETDEALAVRAAAGLAYLQSLPDEVVLLVGHGSYGRALLRLIDPARDTAEQANATIVRYI